jgi:hypothetical protein
VKLPLSEVDKIVPTFRDRFGIKPPTAVENLSRKVAFVILKQKADARSE